MRKAYLLGTLLAGAVAAVTACGNDKDESSGTSNAHGGTTSQAGTGGVAVSAGGTGGGTSGAAAGGTASGGTASGGTASGGTASGGTASGGTPSAGTAGTTSLAGAGGEGGDGGEAGSGAVESCSGCARLSVPLAATNQQTSFMIAFDQPVDLTGMVVTFRVMTYAGTEGGLMPFVQNGADQSWASVGYDWTNLTDAASFHDVTVDVDAKAAVAGNGFDKTLVKQIGLLVAAGGGAGPWTNPTVVYVDSVTIDGDGAGGAGGAGAGGAGGAGAGGADGIGSVPWPFEFTSGSDPLVINAGDNPVAGSAVSWVGP